MSKPEDNQATRPPLKNVGRERYNRQVLDANGNRVHWCDPAEDDMPESATKWCLRYTFCPTEAAPADWVDIPLFYVWLLSDTQLLVWATLQAYEYVSGPIDYRPCTAELGRCVRMQRNSVSTITEQLHALGAITVIHHESQKEVLDSVTGEIKVRRWNDNNSYRVHMASEGEFLNAPDSRLGRTMAANRDWYLEWVRTAVGRPDVYMDEQDAHRPVRVPQWVMWAAGPHMHTWARLQARMDAVGGPIDSGVLTNLLQSYKQTTNEWKAVDGRTVRARLKALQAVFAVSYEPGRRGGNGTSVSRTVSRMPIYKSLAGMFGPYHQVPERSDWVSEVAREFPEMVAGAQIPDQGWVRRTILDLYDPMSKSQSPDYPQASKSHSPDTILNNKSLREGIGSGACDYHSSNPERDARGRIVRDRECACSVPESGSVESLMESAKFDEAKLAELIADGVNEVEAMQVAAFELDENFDPV